MNFIVVDRGNTRTKVAVFTDRELLSVHSFDTIKESDLAHVIAEFPASQAIVSSSGDQTNEIVGWLKNSGVGQVCVFDHTTPIPLKNCYQTPETLGVDRLATAVGAAQQIPGQDLLIFDFGTALTIDFVSAQGEFKGGNITPGLAMRFAALHRFTKRLPLIETGVWSQSSRSFGLSTHEAIYRGVVNGICHEIEGYIQENPEKTVIFTGGDALFFEKQIKKPIFVSSQATLIGLRTILEAICSKE